MRKSLSWHGRKESAKEIASSQSYCDNMAVPCEPPTQYDKNVVISVNLIQQSPSKVREQDLIVFGEHLCRDFCLTFVNSDHG